MSLRFWFVQTSFCLLALTFGCNPSGGNDRGLGEDPLDLGIPSPDGGQTDGGAISDGGSNSDAGDGGTSVAGSVCTPSGFCFEYPAKFGIALNDVWASSPIDVWAVGYSGALLHFDGTSWTIAKSPTRNTLYGIVGRSSSNILTIKKTNTTLHYNNTN